MSDSVVSGWLEEGVGVEGLLVGAEGVREIEGVMLLIGCGESGSSTGGKRMISSALAERLGGNR